MKKLTLLLASVALLSACKKDSETTPSTPTKTDLLTAKSWRISAQTYTTTVTGTTAVTTDAYAASPACERDDFTKFNTNKTLTADEGASKCNTTDPQTQTGSWDFNSDFTKLTITDPSQGSLALQFDVVELSATTLRLRYTNTSSVGGISASVVNNVTFTSF